MIEPVISMRRALADPQLLGSALAGESWRLWRIVLIAAMGEPLTPDELAAFQAVTGRDKSPDQRVEEALFLIGRRGGKDRAASVVATYLGALVDWSPVLAKGERAMVLCIGPDQRQAKISRDYIEGVFNSSPVLSGLVVNRTADTLELSNGISIEVRAANFRRLRGVTAVAVIATEAAFWLSDETSGNPDSEILNAVRPSLATTGGPLIVITTPYARRGEVWELYRKHYGPAGDPAILIAQGTTRDFNTTLSQAVINRALARDHAAASAEYLAQFRSDVESLLAREAIEAVTIPGRYELPPVAGAQYSAHVDPSGGSADSMTLAIARMENQAGVLCATRECRPPFSPEAVVSEFAALMKTYGVTTVVGDRYAGEWPRERFRVHGIRYDVAEKSASDFYREFLPLINGRRVELLDHPRLAAQLCALERRTSRSGRDNISHPPQGHDDLANAVAAVLVQVAGQDSMEIWNRLADPSVRARIGNTQAQLKWKELMQ